MSTPLIEFELWAKNSWPSHEIVGESFHEKELRSLFPTKIGENDRELRLRAALVPDPTNKFDPNAVKVTVAGQHIGHLAKDQAAKYQPVLNALLQRGLLPVTDCRIWGSEYEEWVGTDRRGREITRPKFTSGVTLTLDEWYLCVPTNQPPAQPHTMLPQGGALQVRKEENHQAVLQQHVSRHGECWVYGTLHAIIDTLTKTPKQLVEIRIDDQRVGELTPAMSAEFLPVVVQLAERGRATAAKLIVKGNQIKADAVLYAARAHQLDADWISTNITAAVPVAASTTVASSPPPRAEDVPIPPKPTRIRFCTPPGWPPAPDGWEPLPGWRPDPNWPPAPLDWRYWQAD